MTAPPQKKTVTDLAHEASRLSDGDLSKALSSEHESVEMIDLLIEKKLKEVEGLRLSLARAKRRRSILLMESERRGRGD